MITVQFSLWRLFVCITCLSIAIALLTVGVFPIAAVMLLAAAVAIFGRDAK